MSFLEIIIIGILFNFAVIVIVGLITIIYNLSRSQFNFNFQKEILALQKLSNEYINIKNELKERNLSRYTQNDFVILLPFSKIVMLFYVITHFFTGTLNLFLIQQMENGLSILRNRLEKDKNDK